MSTYRGSINDSPVLCSRNPTLVPGAVLRTRSTTQKKTKSLNSCLPCWNLRMNSWTNVQAFSRLEGAQRFHLMLNELSSPVSSLNKHLTRSQPLSQSRTLAAMLANTIPRVLLHITILHKVCGHLFFSAVGLCKREEPISFWEGEGLNLLMFLRPLPPK